MSKLTWDQESERLYETGVSECALYVYDSSKKAYGTGVAWNGIKGITESPSGAETTSLYANNSKYLDLVSVEELSGTINAYMFPDEWAKCDGSTEIAPGVYVGQQSRASFGLVYKTIIGNDTEGTDHGYKLHIIYGGKASPSERTYNSVNDSPEANDLSWTFKTTPVEVNGHNKTSIITIDSTKVDGVKLKDLEKILYGDESNEPKLPLPNEIFTTLGATVTAQG